MNLLKILVSISVLTLLASCVTVQTPKECPSGTYWDANLQVCVQKKKAVKAIMPIKPEAICPDSSIIDLNQAVNMATECVKSDKSKFNTAFATLISIAQQSPDINNGAIILKFIKAVAIDAPFVPAKAAKMKWNRYFSPNFFVSMGYMYDNIKNYCKDKAEIKRNIDEELGHKKVGLLKCMANNRSKNEAAALYRQAEQTAIALKRGLDAACMACCSPKKLIQ